MHERATYRSGEAGHLDIEDLAALIDGTLPPEEAAGARAHLARCEPCLALFTETASFLREDAEAEEIDEVEVVEDPAPAAPPLPFVPQEQPPPLREQRRARRWAALAAAAATLVVGAAAFYRDVLGPPQVETARLLASLAARQAAAVLPYWGPTQRGASAGPDDRALAAFRLGVELTNLDAAFTVGDRAQAMAATARINGLLDAVTVAPDTKQLFRGLPARIESGASAASFAGDLNRARVDLEGYLARPDYDLGRWTEAGRLAAAAGAPDFLTARDTRRFPDAIRRELHHSLAPRAGAALDEIAKILDRDALTAEDYKSLDARFQEILATYYPV